MEFHAQKQHAFSLIELLITLFVLAILVAIAVPSFMELTERNKVSAAVNSFLSHLHLARTEAIKRDQFVLLCPSSNGKKCNNSFKAWGKGYMIFVDNDRDRKPDTREERLKYINSEEEAVRIYSSKGRQLIAYRPSGRAWDSNVTLRFCAEKDEKHNRAIIVHNTGRARVESDIPVTCD